MKDIMIDLETLGQSAGCVILSIGAVAFDANGLGKEFYCVVNTADCKKVGLTTDADTISWWDKQDPKAREVLKQAASKSDSVPLKQALDDLTRFIHSVCSGQTVRVHGNGASFDNAILAVAYRLALREMPWKFWNDRCHRTNKAKGPRGSEPQRQGTYHNALDDAKHQARHAIELHRLGINIFA